MKKLCALLTTLVLFGTGFSPSQPQTSSSKPQDSGKQTSADADKLKLPAGSILVVVDELKDLIKPEAKLIVLTPEKYRELTAQLEQLKQQLSAERKLPHTCKLSAKLVGDVLQAEAQFVFTTEAPNTPVLLGLHGGYLTEAASLDGELPMLDSNNAGLVVRVAKAGVHTLKLKLNVPVGSRRAAGGIGIDRFVNLGLPEAAVTTVALELPEAIKEIRCNDTVEKPGSLGQWDLALGKPKQLKLEWKEPFSASGAAPYLTADAKITMKLEDTQAVVTADVMLEDVRGRTSEWQLFLPFQAKVDVKSPADLRFEIIRPGAKDQPFLLKLKEPRSEPLQVSVETRHPRPFAPPRLAIGPFHVVGALQQQGTIIVKASPTTLKGARPVFYRAAETIQQEIPASQASETLAAFHYWSPSISPKGKLAAKAPLEVELKAEKVKVEAIVEHNLRVNRAADSWQVDATTKIRVKALSPGIDYVDVQLPRPRPEAMLFVLTTAQPAFPANLPLGIILPGAVKHWPIVAPEFISDSEPGAPTAEMQPPDATRRARIKLSRLPDKEFTLTLTGRYLLPPDAQAANLDLPRLLDPQRAKVTTVLDDQHRLSGRFAEAEEIVGDKHVYTTTWEQVAASANLAWRPFRRDVTVTGQADIFVGDDDVRIRQEFTLLSPPKSRGSGVRLRVPSEVKEIAVLSGTKKQFHQPEGDIVAIPFSPESKTPIVLEYQVPISNSEKNDVKRLEVSLIWPDNATRVEGTARIWTNIETQPVLKKETESPWRETRSRPLAGRDSLPALTLESTAAARPLKLELRSQASPLFAKALIDRELVQIILGQDGSHYYRSRFFVRKMNASSLEVEIPVRAVGLSVSFDQVKLTNISPVEKGDGNIVKFQVDPQSPPTILEIDYKLPAAGASWLQTFRPARFTTNVFIKDSRWHVAHAPGAVAVPVESNLPIDYEWGLRGGLLSPEPAVSAAELEAWLGGREKAEAQVSPQITFWRRASAPAQLLVIPKQLWFLGCSALLLMIGLVSFSVARSYLLFVIAVLGFLLIATSVIFPGVLPFVLYGSQPGALVLLVVVLVQWLLRERYRRQVVFLPGFARVKGGSSLLRGRPVEPSTIDASAPMPSAGPPSSQKKSST